MSWQTTRITKAADHENHDRFGILRVARTLASIANDNINLYVIEYVIANGVEGNFDVAVRDSFAVAVAVISDFFGN